MGTNYYAVAPPGKRVYLGKSSVGWQFLLKADREWKPEEAFGLWLERVHSAYLIVNEYGAEVTASELIQYVCQKQNEAISHTEYIREHYPSYVDDFWDDDGFNFTSGEFS
jgi:hypothetical protein